MTWLSMLFVFSEDGALADCSLLFNVHLIVLLVRLNVDDIVDWLPYVTAITECNFIAVSLSDCLALRVSTH